MTTVVTKIAAKKRTTSGSRHSHRLRLQGIVPANVYGHGQEPTAISIPVDAARPLVTSGHKVVDLEVDGVNEKALLREVQWDTYGLHLLHLDFLRIDATQRVSMDVPIHLKGTAPGVLLGGILEQPLHSLHVECLAIEVPDEIAVRITALNKGEAIHVRDLTDLPASVVVKNPSDAIIVHVVEAKTEEEPTPGVAGLVEPEVVGKKKDEDDGEE